MKNVAKIEQSPEIKIERVHELSGVDLHDLCEATEATIKEDALSFSIGMGRVEPLSRERLEAYWKGVMLVPERQLIIGRLDGVIASSIQLVRPAPNQHASSFAGSVDHHFVAPWARGYGLAKELLAAVEDEARTSGLEVLRLSVRENLHTARQLYENFGYHCWGKLDKYEKIDGKMIAGLFYYKDLV